MRSRRTTLALAGAVAAILLAAAPVLAALDTVSGHAYGESVDVTLLNALHVTSGPAPSTGELTSNGSNSPLDNSATTACVPAITCDVLSAGVLTVHTEGTTGATGTVKSTANVADVDALTGILTATAVYSECDIASNGAATGFTTLTGASLDHSQSLAVTPGPNTNITLSGTVSGTLTLNEQIYDSGTNTLTVNAIHLHLTAGSFGTGDIIIAQSQCDATPAGPAPVIPESPLALLLPLTGLVVVGAALLVTMRRRAVFVER
jgi:hypothetical protein